MIGRYAYVLLTWRHMEFSMVLNTLSQEMVLSKNVDNSFLILKFNQVWLMIFRLNLGAFTLTI